MGIQRLNYTQIPKALRARTAAEIQGRLRSILSDPSTSAEQRTFVLKQTLVMKHWIAGNLPTEPVGAPDYQALAEAAETP